MKTLLLNHLYYYANKELSFTAKNEFYFAKIHTFFKNFMLSKMWFLMQNFICVFTHSETYMIKFQQKMAHNNKPRVCLEIFGILPRCIKNKNIPTVNQALPSLLQRL